MSVYLKFSVLCHFVGILPQQVKHIRKQFVLKKSSVIGKIVGFNIWIIVRLQSWDEWGNSHLS